MLFLVLANAQELRTIQGRIIDYDSHQPVVAASVTDMRQHNATVTNEDGTFILRTDVADDTIVVSHIGYTTKRVGVSDNGKPERIMLRHSTIMLNEIIAAKPEDVVALAVRNIGANYLAKPVIQQCFYRETTRKGSRYIYVAEAITDMYRKPYTEGIDYDRVSIRKARRLISTSVRDTLGAKLLGGPTTPLTLDIVKNLDLFLTPENLAFYDFTMQPTLSNDGKGLVKISFSPKDGAVRACPYALNNGDLYITTDSLAIDHAELHLVLTDKVKASRAMLYSKPAGVRFKPRGLDITMTYKTDKTGRLSLSYLRSEVSFVCEWKRKLFAAPYHVVSEMVVTGEDTENVVPIRSRASFSRHESLYDHPEYFRDPDFWKQYNIIAPSESLEKGVSRLLKKTEK